MAILRSLLLARELEGLLRVLRLGPNKCPEGGPAATELRRLGCAKNEASARNDLPQKGETVSTKLGRRARLNTRPRARHWVRHEHERIATRTARHGGW